MSMSYLVDDGSGCTKRRITNLIHHVRAQKTGNEVFSVFPIPSNKFIGDLFAPFHWYVKGVKLF